MQVFALPKQMPREARIARLTGFLAQLSQQCAWEVTVRRVRRTRSQAQNRYLWGVAYPAILAHLPGWTAEDVHDYCLGECFGWETLTGFERRRLRPIKRSATLTVTEFQDFVADIQRRMAEQGIDVPDPNEEQT
jgi:hypothetical protein